MCARTLISAMDAMQQRNIPMGMSQVASNAGTLSSCRALLAFIIRKTSHYKTFQTYPSEETSTMNPCNAHY